jgi:hypothetical protein
MAAHMWIAVGNCITCLLCMINNTSAGCLLHTRFVLLPWTTDSTAAVAGLHCVTNAVLGGAPVCKALPADCNLPRRQAVKLTSMVTSLGVLPSSLNWTTPFACTPQPWPGLVCQAGSVTGLYLSNVGLSGPLGTSLTAAEFSTLQVRPQQGLYKQSNPRLSYSAFVQL